MKKNIKSKKLWDSKEIAAALSAQNTTHWVASGISIDSRRIIKGDLFIAIAGAKFDGNKFTHDALIKGAVAAIVSHDPKDFKEKKPVIIFRNTALALKKIGEFARARTKAKIIAVTGSVGKTTTKELLREILEKEGPTTSTIGNLNNQIGLPLSLSRMPKESAFGIFELGMNRPGEISKLTKIAKPDIAIITNVEKAHLKFFKSFKEVALAKSEIFKGMTGSIGILNRDNQFYDLLKKVALQNNIKKIITFGEHRSSNIRLLNYALKNKSSECTAIVSGKKVQYRLSSAGKHWIINSLIILATALALKLNIKQVAKRLGKTKPIIGRGEKHNIRSKSAHFTLLDDSYNACPASMKNGIEILSNMKTNGRRIAVLGDMLELGKESKSMHLELKKDLIKANINLVFTSGKYMKTLHKTLPKTIRGGHNNNPEKLGKSLVPKIRKNDIVFVKGSNGTKMMTVVKILRSIGMKDKK